MLKKLLIANRGEVAIRVARSASDLGIETVSIYSKDDASSLHTRHSDSAVSLSGSGVAAYLDIEQIILVALASGCDSVHPGYGFLSENAEFASKCLAAGLVFVGPTVEQLMLFGSKSQARDLARSCGVPVLPGTNSPTSLTEARSFLETLGNGQSVMLKAIAGGGGRGIRRVDNVSELEAAFERCSSEAMRSFGNPELFVEQFVPRARHIEVQIIGDSEGGISHIWDRECSLQRQNQKIVEIAPAVGISEELRERLFAAATTMAKSVRYQNLGTFEFLVDADRFFFLEANPRLQVEHTVTEEVTGLDLVALQLGIADGRTLDDLGILQSAIPQTHGISVQCRINMETIAADGTIKPAGGTLAVYEAPSGPGVRVDGFGYAGYHTSARYDSLLAKLIVHVGSTKLSDAMIKAHRTLREFKIVGVSTNLSLLKHIVTSPDVREGHLHTRFIEERLVALTASDGAAAPARFFEQSRSPRLAGAQIDKSDPLAILHSVPVSGRPDLAANPAADPIAPEGTVPLRAPLQGTIISLSVQAGDLVTPGMPVLVMDAMKMEHVVASDHVGIVREFTVGPGDTVYETAVLAFIEPQAVQHEALVVVENIADRETIRPDLAELHRRQAIRSDASRNKAVERRHATGQRTARENIEDLCDPGSFVEFGGLTIAARRLRNPVEELMHTTPADGFIMGTARVNGDRFSSEMARCAVMSYDPTVMAGTQGLKGHEKLDRILELAAKSKLPVIFFTEGGGGRPGDSDKLGVGFNFIRTFSYLGQLSGLVPLVGVNNGRCFAGNAFILGCCDVVIATKNSTIGIGGPAVIEGAGLGAYKAEDVGPVSMQAPNGVIDVLVEDEAAAVSAAKKYIGYFQGPVTEWSHDDQRLLRSVIPENRRRVYDMRKLIAILADTDSVMELRAQFGIGIITALIRVEGRPIGVIANNPHHLGGAIDSASSDKAARFMQLCEAFDLPILSLCDTPGYMIGPEAEKNALIRHCARMVVIGSNLTVPLITVVVRKAYGLGGLAMAGGSFSNSIIAVAWPTGEFGGMPMEGLVKLGFRDQLAAIEDVNERRAKFEQMVADNYEGGKAVNAATFYEFDDVIDPIDTRRRIMEALRSVPPTPRRDKKKLSWIDTW